MKAETGKPSFLPIVLTLETEAEAKAIYAVLNHVRLCKILGIDDDVLPSDIGMPMTLADSALQARISAALK